MHKTTPGDHQIEDEWQIYLFNNTICNSLGTTRAKFLRGARVPWFIVISKFGRFKNLTTQRFLRAS